MSRLLIHNVYIWMRVELGTILMKFVFEISFQLWSPL